MDVEDEYLDLLKRKERSHAEALETTRKELEEARTREDEARMKEKEARAREEEERRQKEYERRQKEQAFAELADLKRRLGKMKK